MTYLTRLSNRTPHAADKMLLEYDENLYEMVEMSPTDERDGVFVAVQERLPHVPDYRVDSPKS